MAIIPYLKLAHEIEDTIYITKNGEGDIVVMSIEAFERKEKMMKLKFLKENLKRQSGFLNYLVWKVR